MTTQLKQIADHYLLRGLFCQEVGLWEGKTGMSLFFFLLSRHTGNRWYEEFAGELLDDVCGSLSLHSPVTFADGLCGIGWAIEFLKKEGFIEGNTDEILEEVDRKVMERDVRRITDASLETGLAGIAAYVYSRLNSLRDNNEHPLFDSKYLEELDASCERLRIDKYISSYDVHSIFKEILSAYSTDSSAEEKSWKKGLIILSEQTYSFNTNFITTENEITVDQYIYEDKLRNSFQKVLLIFTEESNGASYGVGTYIKYLTRCFNTTEWSINVIEMSKSCEYITFSFQNGIAYYGIPRINSDKYHRVIFHYLASRLECKMNIYCHFNFFGKDQLAIRFKESFNAYIVFTLHYMNWKFKLNGNEEHFKNILNKPTNKEEEKILLDFEKEKDFMMKCCDCIISVSRHSYKTLHDLYEIPTSKLSLIPNAVKHNSTANMLSIVELRKKYGFSKKEKIILFVGRLERNKGIFDLISAFKQTLESIPEARLVIAGSGDLKGCMEAVYPFNHFVTFMGFVKQIQLEELYRIANISVVPSYFEEFGYVAAEIMLNQRPIIVRNTAGLREITANGRYAILFNDSDDLSEKIINCISQNANAFFCKKERNEKIINFSFPLFEKRVKNTYLKAKK